MLIILKKEPGTNRFEYPDTPTLFTNQFPHPVNSGELIAQNDSGRTLGDLSDSVSYGVVEYTGEIPSEPLLERLVASKDIIQAIPLGTEWYLKQMIANIDLTDDAKKTAGFMADRILTLLTGGEQIDVNSPAFDSMATWLISAIDDITQSTIDVIKAL